MLLFSLSCQKDNNTNPSDDNQGVAFVLSTNSTLKSSDCFSKQADYAKINISGTSYKVDVFYIDSKPYTNTLHNL